ncbi:uncharacterized protein C1orf131 homolog [Hoplias malabaricus]|uniref:uncharacterized protein C1orf131 homolog n=1 Tax=Hoplias malabaricus TaxID=27720 RepID=UPI0034623DCE
MKRVREEDGEEDDVDFLDRVLSRLYDFGDGAKGKRSKKKHKTRKGVNEDEVEMEEEASNEADDIQNRTDLGQTNGTEGESSAATKSDVKVITFQDPRKKNTLKKPVEPETKILEVKGKKKKDPEDALSIEKARLEVHRFGITGFQKEQQRVFEQDRAIMLGARPPKKDYVNYKVYQRTIKEKRLREKEEMRAEAPVKKRNAGKPGKQKTEKRKSSSSGGEPSGQVGRFKNGMLVLSNKDIQKLNAKVRK